jgi:hypothetical protein
MQRLLMAASSILLLTMVAHSQPFAPRRLAHRTAFILAGDDGSGSSENGDASVTDDSETQTPLTAGAPPGPPPPPGAPPVVDFSGMSTPPVGKIELRATNDAQ